MMYCIYCGLELPERTKVCPRCSGKLPQPDVPVSSSRSAFPVAALICGIVASFCSYLAWQIVILSSANGFRTVLLVLCPLLGAAGVVFGIIGLLRSIHTTGRKNVPGIVLSAVGLAAAVYAFLFFLQNIMMGGFIQSAFQDVFQRFIQGNLPGF